MERNTRRLYLTGTGIEFYSRARAILADLKDAEPAVNAQVDLPLQRVLSAPAVAVEFSSYMSDAISCIG